MSVGVNGVFRPPGNQVALANLATRAKASASSRYANRRGPDRAA